MLLFSDTDIQTDLVAGAFVGIVHEQLKQQKEILLSAKKDSRTWAAARDGNAVSNFQSPFQALSP